MKKIIDFFMFIGAMFILFSAKADPVYPVKTSQTGIQSVDTIADYVGFDYSVTIYRREGDYFINEVVMDSSLGEILLAHDSVQFMTTIKHITYFVSDTTSDDMGFHSGNDIYLHLERGEDNPSGDLDDEIRAGELATGLGMSPESDEDLSDLYGEDEYNLPILTDGSANFTELPTDLVLQLSKETFKN